MAVKLHRIINAVVRDILYDRVVCNNYRTDL